jgi:hypothetical protein
MSLAPLIAARTCAYHTAWLDLVGFSIGCIRSELPVIGGGGMDDELAMTLDSWNSEVAEVVEPDAPKLRMHRGCVLIS